MLRGRSTQRYLVAGEGFVFVVGIYGFFFRTASTAVSDTIMSSLFFYREPGKYSQKNPRQNAAEILRSKHSIFVLATVTFDRGQEL